MPEATIAFIGGSGLYGMEGLDGAQSVEIDTPFGSPSDLIVVGSLAGTRVAFLPRHGRGHRLSPTEIPVRANIYALKSLGVDRVVSISAVGSLREEVRPLDFVVPHQIIDRTRHRSATFFEDGVVAHVGMADPYCLDLKRTLVDAGKFHGASVHEGGTYIVIEGPQFSTRAESELYRSWGASIIGMTAMPEAKLAREAEMCYATLASVTDYDVWHQSEAEVSVELVVANLMKNVALSQDIIRSVAPKLDSERTCSCGDALRDAIITAHNQIDDEARERLGPIIGRYVGSKTEQQDKVLQRR